MGKIITIGEILVEIVATEKNQKFDETGTFTGPYPSGAPAIFADQSAKIGSETVIVSAVGDDGFGRMNMKRLESSGVDISYVKVIPTETTGSAFVSYEDNGSRDFIFNITNAACGKVDESYIDSKLFEDCSYFHIMGSSVYSKGIQDAITKSLDFINNSNAKISFDPNVRKEILNEPAKFEFLKEILGKAHIVMAGEDELELLMANTNLQENIDTLLQNYNAEIVVVKYGSKGSSVHTREMNVNIDPYVVEEVDPTGAGDCFAGTFISSLNTNTEIVTAAKYASIAGGLAVTKVGPMEGNSTLTEIQSRYSSN